MKSDGDNRERKTSEKESKAGTTKTGFCLCLSLLQQRLSGHNRTNITHKKLSKEVSFNVLPTSVKMIGGLLLLFLSTGYVINYVRR